MSLDDDEFSRYRDEWETVIARLIARAWSDEAFKQQLLSDPVPALHAEGLMFPDRYVVEFYDDPAAALRDWHSIGRGNRAVHRFPIPAAPDGLEVNIDTMGALDTSALACCCPCASCTGAVAHTTWY